MTNRVALFARSIRCLSLNVMVMMLSMNPSIDDFMAVISTARGQLLQGDPMSGVYFPLGVGSYVVSLDIFCPMTHP